jgi:hypothetical protein
MTAYVFIGPTIRPADATAELAAVYLPPVQQGDVYRVATGGRPRSASSTVASRTSRRCGTRRSSGR